MKRTRKAAVYALAALIALLLAACAGTPELQDGERYFEGDIAFEHTESCTVSYILSADGKSIRDTTIVMKDLSYTGSSNGRTVREKAGTSVISFGGGQPDGQGYLELKTRAVTLRLNVTADSVRGEMDYSHKSKPGEKPTIDLFIGTYPFEMEDKTDSLEAR